MHHHARTLCAWSLVLGLGILAMPAAPAGTPLIMEHVHGLSYNSDGKRLMVPGHDGLVLYEDGRWAKAQGPAHHYTGFSATRDALYSSGHPAPGSAMADPLGLIKSNDDGKSWQQLGFAGESDFHTLATSHATNAIYLANREANSRMSQPGIHYTMTDGIRWQRAADKGRGYLLHALAVHPTDAAVVAASTDVGLYLSRNSADTFEQLVGGKVVIAVSFSLDGRHLWFSTYDGKAGLERIALTAGARSEAVPLPGHAEDAVAYIAQNPVRRTEVAIATFQRNVFVSKDLGRTWIQIAKDGTTLE